MELNDDKNLVEVCRLLFQEKSNVFLSGPGGCGKSHLIRQLKDVSQSPVAVTASTGVAAIGVGGRTVHSFFGVGLARGTVADVVEYASRNGKAMNRLRRTQILVIDEISMIGADLFAKLEAVARAAKNGAGMKEEIKRMSTQDFECKLPFGGMQVVISGDFLQLPPVNDLFCYKHPTFAAMNFKIVEMVIPYRFSDVSFHEMLLRVRRGEPSDDDKARLKSRAYAYKDYKRREKRPDEIRPTVLYSCNRDVNTQNAQELAKLEGEVLKFGATDKLVGRKNGSVESCEYLDDFRSRTFANHDKIFEALALSVVELKIHAQVMLTYNIDVEGGLVNGSRGVITDISDAGVTVQFRNGAYLVERHTFEYVDDTTKYQRIQYPLKLAYALTIHKSQGATLDMAIVDVGPSVFEPGQAYVALSRVRSWDSLYISNYSSRSLKAHRGSLAYYYS